MKDKKIINDKSLSLLQEWLEAVDDETFQKEYNEISQTYNCGLTIIEFQNILEKMIDKRFL